jgi:putative ABC transport system ATP-binding protein
MTDVPVVAAQAVAGAAVSDGAVIEARGLSHWFGEDGARRRVLDGVDLVVHPGEIVILTGPSGSGKTTLLALVAALRSVQEGSLRVLGTELRDVRPPDAVSVRRRIGFVFQSHNLLRALTALQNVALAPALLGSPPAEARARALDALHAVGLPDRADAMPRQLSGGQRQRVAVARALVGRPAIVLADEPTASLDSTTGREVTDLLRELARARGCAVLLVTHDPRILDVADRILSIEDGRLETAGQTLHRIAVAEAELLALLPGYIERLRAQDLVALGPMRDRFARGAAEAQTQIADLERKNLPGPLRDQAFALQRSHSQCVELERSLVEFLELCRTLEESPALAGRRDTFVEAFDAVLRAAVEASRSRAALDVEVLLSMTEDRGPLMRDIRRSALQSGAAMTLEEQATLFEVTHVFERMTYFLRALARELALSSRSAID